MWPSFAENAVPASPPLAPPLRTLLGPSSPGERCCDAALFVSSSKQRHPTAKMGKGAIFSPAHESWRKHPMLQVKLRHMFPGFGYAVAIFSTYCAGEWFYNRITGKKAGH
jgi:hypothetical protein